MPPKPRLHGQIHPAVSPRGTMNPDFPSPMPPMAGDAEQLGKEEQGDQVLDRPECLPAFRVPRLTDRVAIVQLGFRSRPLRDGGGETRKPTSRSCGLSWDVGTSMNDAQVNPSSWT